MRNLTLALAVSVALSACGDGIDLPPSSPQLFAQTNDTNNAVLRFIRNANGTLTPLPTVQTGGKGTNGVNYFMGNTVSPDALTSNHSLIVSPDGKRLFVANAGDNTITTMSIAPNGDLSVQAVSPTGGIRPTSIAFANGVLYVTHQQGANELGAYRVGADGSLTSIGQYATVQQDALPTQVGISPDGKFVIVNVLLKSLQPVQPNQTLLAFPVNSDGTLGQPVVSKSSSVGPFAGRFGTGSRGGVFVTADAPAGTASAYTFAPTGTFSSTSPPVPVTGQAAPCWISITPDNRFVYISNGQGTVSLFSLGADGRLSLENPVAASESGTALSATSFAADSWISPDGKFLYQDYSGADKIVSYAISATGALTKVGEQPVNTASKISLQGLTGI
ncbi:lactonase family protein [Burkholderia metallica]|uniref:lactonase family protein n=1 Tax=Burkholderia metallica TaxID=488729 RepID=UPI001CF44C30|nr:beta-propeller fold lactonase family protein [Burkholderia metallica]MCA8023620.1 lactonase family protein [Burkholderia metallica]